MQPATFFSYSLNQRRENDDKKICRLSLEIELLKKMLGPIRIGGGGSIEKRTYIRGESKESLGMNFFSPFQPEREFKVYKSCKCSQIICNRVH